MQAHAAADDESILKVIEAFMDGWNCHDMEAHTSAFAVEADFVDVTGTLLRGRRQIAEEQGKRHVERFSKSSVKTLDVSIRFIRPDVAIVHHWWEMAGDAGAEGQGASLRRGIFTFLMSREDGRWGFEAAHNSDLK